MSERKYIGSRYVPIFADPPEWDGTKAYEPLTIVLHNGASYTSRQYVPAGVDISRNDMWALTGNYDAQVEQYLQEVRTFDDRITANTNAIATETNARENADTALGARIDANTNAISTEATARADADTALDERITTNAEAIAAEATARADADTALDGRITANAEAIAAEATTRADAIAAEATTRADAIANVRTRVSQLQDIQNREMPLQQYVYPRRIGIVRQRTGTYSNVAGHSGKWAQGLCYNASDGYLYIIIKNKDTSNPECYVHRKKPTTSAEVEYVKPVDLYHGSDLIYIPEIGEFWCSKGEDGVIFRLNTAWDIIGNFTVGSSATLLAYDKATGKVYANDYWGALYEVNPQTLEVTDLDISVPSDKYKQSISVHDGILSVLFSYPSQIVRIDIKYNKIAGIFNIAEKNVCVPIGETEGIDTDNAGNLFLSTFTSARNSSVWLNSIFNLNLRKHYPDVISNAYTRAIYVDEASEDNLKSHQDPDGTEGNPFPTIDEAVLYQQIHPWVRTFFISGDHSEEKPYLLLPTVLEGSNGNVGAVQTEAAFSGFFNMTFKPRVSVTHLIQGYRNGPITVINCSKDTSIASNTGSDVGSQSPINTSTGHSTNF